MAEFLVEITLVILFQKVNNLKKSVRGTGEEEGVRQQTDLS
jgi:hypothetical protein